ncbi:NAD(P)/FAD-dependent oxidoreductase [Lactobacillus sp. ESL0791]|uniref:NAD(P)/FAD-dependent oxidoreductase n=1 Tax=Lactobacillus sp. ESL0791 TaxID=2983234 RepID=UPI0023FA082D|nr:NAD(P)/FAD-dependent oxidoreductase [Lactobacillus sp. ESL0791]MDF7638484.1 NAD(P)/FAD-dependent oxidoreductase [Lactobacillus sp. ESL0791]
MVIIKKFDLAIVGGGPVGLFAANFAHLHGLKTILFEALPDIGGQPKQLYSFKRIYDIPAYPEITGVNLITQLAQPNFTVKTSHCVKDIVKNGESFIIDEDFTVKSVIIATGIGSFKPRKFPLSGDSKTSQHIHYYVKNPQDFAKQDVGILGGGDSALDWANELAKYAHVSLIHRRNQFRGLESSVNKLQSLKNVEILTPFLPKEINLVDNKLQIALKKVGSDEVLNKTFSQIIVAYGFQANNQLAKNWGIGLTGTHIKVSFEMKTNIAGIYAIGDAVDYPGRVPVIGLGFGEAQVAVAAVMRELFPEKTLTIHSTSI